MADPYLEPDGSVDVAKVMAALRARIERRRAGQPVDEVVKARLEALADASELGPDVLGPLMRGERGWNLDPDYPVKTHRSGLGAFVVVSLKRLVRPLVRFYTDPIVERQAQINLYLLRVVEALLEETTRLQRAADEPREPR